jgi:ketosteroid isomerase-like protein
MRQFGKALFTLVLAAACSHGTIANTPIPDTADNRDVLSVLAKYKLAVEAKDVDGVMALVSPDYIDVTVPGRQVDARDYSTLKAALQKEFDNTKSVRLEVNPRDVRVQGDSANVDYFYVVRYDPQLPSQPNASTWRSEPDDARMKLKRQNGQWKIVSGL